MANGRFRPTGVPARPVLPESRLPSRRLLPDASPPDVTSCGTSVPIFVACRLCSAAAEKQKAPDQPGLGSTRCGHAAGVLTQVQRHSAGRYFADSVVPAPLQAQVMGPAGGVPAASAAPADVGTIAMFLPFSIFVP